MNEKPIQDVAQDFARSQVLRRVPNQERYAMMDYNEMTDVEGRFNEAAIKACRRLGLTAEQFEGDAIGKLIAAAKMGLELYLNEGIDYAEYGFSSDTDIGDAYRSALRPFTPEAK